MRLADPRSGSAAAVNRYLLPTEDSIVTVRQHPAVLAGSVITVLAGLVAAGILSQLVSASQPLYVVIWIAWGALFLRFLFRATSWSVDYFVITSRRIMMITGLVNRRVAGIPFPLVNDFSLHRSPVGRLLGFGEFRVRYGTRDQVLQRIQYMPFPEQLCLEIHQVMRRPYEAAADDDTGADEEI